MRTPGVFSNALIFMQSVRARPFPKTAARYARSRFSFLPHVRIKYRTSRIPVGTQLTG